MPVIAQTGDAAPVAAAASGPASGTTSAASDIAAARSLSRAFQGVAKTVEPAVVHITQFNRVLVREGIFDVRERVAQTGLGSGVIVSPDGLVLTNNHVAANTERLLVRLTDGREFEGKILGRDELTDIAVLKLEGSNLPYAEFADSDALEVGEWVVAIGSPFGFSNTVTAGIVSAFNRSLTPAETNPYQDFIQTDAAINPGNSGGPLLNLEGKVVGINTAIASNTGANNGLGFAIPSNMARAAMENIQRNGRVLRGWLGVEFADTSQRNAFAALDGVTLNRVIPEGPAAQAGLKAGDVVKSVQGRHVNVQRFRNLVALTPPGDELRLDVEREGKTFQVAVKVEERGAAIARTLDATFVRAIGASVRTFKTDESDRGRRVALQGVQIVNVDPAGVAAKAGLQAGDVVLRVGRRAVASDADFARLMDRADFTEGVVIQVVRGNIQGQLVLQDQ